MECATWRAPLSAARGNLSGRTLPVSCRPLADSQELTRRWVILITADVTPCSRPPRRCLDRGRWARQRVPPASFLVTESLRDRPWLDHLRHQGPRQRSSDCRQRRSSVPDAETGLSVRPRTNHNHSSPATGWLVNGPRRRNAAPPGRQRGSGGLGYCRFGGGASAETAPPRKTRTGTQATRGPQGRWSGPNTPRG